MVTLTRDENFKNSSGDDCSILESMVSIILLREGVRLERGNCSQSGIYEIGARWGKTEVISVTRSRM